MKYLNNLSLSNQAYNTILKQILHFELLPGEVVSDYYLSERLQMSRTPIRNALLQLEKVGLITCVGKKQFISEMNVKNLYEIFVLREALETTALQYVIENGKADAEFIKKLKSFNSDIKQHLSGLDYYSSFEADNSFHLLFSETSGFSSLSSLVENCSVQLMRYRWLTMVATERVDNTTKEHDSIICGIEKGDSKKACDDLRKHIINTRNSYCSILNRFSSDEWVKIIQGLIFSQNYNANSSSNSANIF